MKKLNGTAAAANSADTNSKIQLTPCDGLVKCGLMKVSDLNILKTHPLNRRIDAGHINDFVNIIKEEGDVDVVLKGSEFIVNEVTNTILDGNHKHFAVQKALQQGYIRPDAYVRVMLEHYDTIAEEVNRIIGLNTNSKNWNINDYIDSFVQWERDRGEYDGPYNRLRDFCIKHVLCYAADKRTKETKPKYIYGVTIIKGTRSNNDIKHCGLSITREELEKAHRIHDELCQLRDKMELNMQGSDIEGMAQEWLTQRENIDLEKFLKYKPSKTVMKLPKGNRSEWRQVFLTIRDEQETGSKRAR